MMEKDVKYYKDIDKPIESYEEDKFGTSAIIKGLAKFIKKCNTPMTVSIQGEWGCGKTSTMNMVCNDLKSNNIITVWFNTWKFSQFNMDSQLPITFLTHLTKKLAEHLPKETDSKDKSFLKHLTKKLAGHLSKEVDLEDEAKEKIFSTLKAVIPAAVSHFAGEELGAVVQEFMSPDEIGLIEQLDSLKKNFQDLIDQVLKYNTVNIKEDKTNKDEDKETPRIVVFIDDLDRIQPICAIDLLETLKIFTDCRNCVFVMAIDTSVVYQGIRAKYGHDISEEKMQSFFDKLIQVPFKVPTNHYDMSPMLRELIPYYRYNNYSDNSKLTHINSLVSLLRRITDGNPRSIKRLSNIYYLELEVSKANIELSGNPFVTEEIILILSGLQVRFTDVYDFIVGNMSEELLLAIIDLNLDSESSITNAEAVYQEFVSWGMHNCVISDKVLFCDTICTFRDALVRYDDSADDEFINIFEPQPSLNMLAQLIGFSSTDLPNTSIKCRKMITDALAAKGIPLDNSNIERVQIGLPSDRSISDDILRKCIDVAIKYLFC